MAAIQPAADAMPADNSSTSINPNEPASITVSPPTMAAQWLFCAVGQRHQLLLSTIGQFQVLRSICHPYLSQYLDIKRGSRDIPNDIVTGRMSCRNVAQLVLALDFLNRNGLCHYNISPSALRIRNNSSSSGEGDTDLVLTRWGLHHMTDRGRNVLFPIPHPRYAPPEFLAASAQGPSNQFNPRADVWALGLILLEQRLEGGKFWKNAETTDEREMKLLFQEIKEFDEKSLDALLQSETELSRDFIKMCLIFDVAKRPTPQQLLVHPYIRSIVPKLKPNLTPSSIRSLSQVDLPFNSQARFRSDAFRDGIAVQPICGLTLNETDLLHPLPLAYQYYLWCLTGGNLDVELNTRLERFSNDIPLPSIERLPRFIKIPRRAAEGENLVDRSAEKNKGNNGGEWVELGDRQGMLYDRESIIWLDTGRVVQKLVDFLTDSPPTESELNDTEETCIPISNISKDDLIFYQPSNEIKPLGILGSDVTLLETEANDVALVHINAIPPKFFQQYLRHLPVFRRLPVTIRERDSVYQYHRILIFHQLLQTYPASRKELVYQARIDIPPIFRGKVWACLLGVRGDYETEYYSVNKDAEHEVDRQLEVDIPRCHQYHPHLNNPVAHEKLRRVLKAWCIKNPELVYWQGLDSLCAPFVVNNFNDEPLAFACLQKLISSYLKNFFLHDNSAILQDHLAAFRQLIAFHDPELNHHLNKIGFLPSLYAIPWFLTIFTHVLPIHKINHLWDILFTLPVEPTLPLFIGLAILQHLRASLLQAEFNECISLFQEVGDIDVSKIMNTAWFIRQRTPNSIVSDVGMAPMERSLRKRQSEKSLNISNITATKQEEFGMQAEDLNRALNSWDLKEGERGSQNQSPLSPYDASLRWWDRPIPANVRLREAVPRIALEDVVLMRDSVCIIDVRPEEDFTNGHYPASIGVDSSKAGFYFVSILNLEKFRYFAIVADRGETGPEFAETLANANIAHVAVLNGGIDVVKSISGTVQLCNCKPVVESFGPDETRYWRCANLKTQK